MLKPKTKEKKNSGTVAALILRRCDELAAVTDEPGFTTRTFGSPAMKVANSLVAGWMSDAGMKVGVDAIGNLIGHYGAVDSKSPIFLIGSHLDTVKHAGKYDGPLGVLLGISCVQRIHEMKLQLPFAIRVAGFADEEGVRYHTTYLGSKAVAGVFDFKDLKRTDEMGVHLSQAILDFGGDPKQIQSCAIESSRLVGYLEAHIEQGPVLESKDVSVGVVSSISGQSRISVSFMGMAGHAGTTPMTLRKDALCAAAEFILTVVNYARKIKRMVATTGFIQALPGASNVIPGQVQLCVDVRHESDRVRQIAVTKLSAELNRILRKRKLKGSFRLVQETATAPCSSELTKLLLSCTKGYQKKVPILSSGAGHDAAILSRITPAAMLFIRCKKGISHHPDESVRKVDVQLALDVMNSFIQSLAPKYA